MRKDTQPSVTTVFGSGAESFAVTLVSTTAFILRVDPISEKDLAAALLTKEQGVVRVAVKGARGRSKRAAALQLLTEVEVTYFLREGRELARLDVLEIESSSFDLATRAETAMLLPYVAESVLTFVPEAEPGNDVYRLVRHVLDALSAGVPAALAARYFEVWLLRFCGLLPEDSLCAVCGEELGESVRLDAEIPGFVMASCAGRRGIAVPNGARRLLRAMRHQPLTKLDVKAPAGDLAALEDLSREVRRRFLGHELKSYRFLQALG